MERWLSVLVLIAVVGYGCSADIPLSPPQSWKNYQFRIETRPPVVTTGMNEFLVVANKDGRKPAHDVLVSLRVGETGRWIQAIQDGHVGVYRRALRVIDPKSDVLYVHVAQGKEEAVLEFPLNYQQDVVADSL